MMRTGLFLASLLFAVPIHATNWHIAGKIEVPMLDDFSGYPKVLVQLISGGVWNSECGETLAEADGKFSLTCPSPWNWFSVKHLAVYHRFDDGVCKLNWFADISLDDGQTFKIDDSTKYRLTTKIALRIFIETLTILNLKK
ncbi:unnamed protein product [Bursaphelenchus xylophilus]|nr:unnamed protein product [Bursaphelenchus xylophilus]CAG9104959.1 unnamed protein product [Bursaphelenchus xylophilus]